MWHPAYWSMPMYEQDKEQTAFSVENGKYVFYVTPYGLCNARASYQRMMDVCLAGLPPNRVLAYMDDVIIFSKTFTDHIKAIEDVFNRFRVSGVSLKASKCHVAATNVNVLGFQLSKDGIKTERELTKAIELFDRPSNKKRN